MRNGAFKNSQHNCPFGKDFYHGRGKGWQKDALQVGRLKIPCKGHIVLWARRVALYCADAPFLLEADLLSCLIPILVYMVLFSSCLGRFAFQRRASCSRSRLKGQRHMLLGVCACSLAVWHFCCGVPCVGASLGAVAGRSGMSHSVFLLSLASSSCFSMGCVWRE